MHGTVRAFCGGLSERFANLRFDFACDVAVFFQERLRVFTALTDALIAVGVPRTTLADDILLECNVEN